MEKLDQLLDFLKSSAAYFFQDDSLTAINNFASTTLKVINDWFIEWVVNDGIKPLIGGAVKSITRHIVEKVKNQKLGFPSRLISLEEAACVARKALYNTPIGDIIDRLNAQHVAGYFIYDFLAFGVTFFGRHTPSTIYACIPEQHLKYGSFKKEDSYGFYRPYAPTPTYTELKIEYKQLKRYIKTRTNDYKELNASFTQYYSYK